MSAHNTSKEIRRLVLRELDPETPVVAFDLDEVLWNVNYAYVEEINKAIGTSFTVEDLTTYNMTEATGVPLDVFHNILHNTDAFARVVPCQFARELVEGIRDGSLCSYFGLESRPHKVVFITHRGYRPDGTKVTFDLLKEHDLLPDELVVAQLGSSKVVIADEYYGEYMSLMFEDHPVTINDFLLSGFPVVRSCRPWNRDVWADFVVDLNQSSLPRQATI